MAEQTPLTNPRHGVGLYNAHNVLVDNVRAVGCFDAVYVGAARIDGIEPLDACSDVTIRDCLFESNERNAVSVTRGRHITIRGCLMRDNCLMGVSGVVAIEGNQPTDEMLDIKIVDNTISDNRFWGVRVVGSTGAKGPIIIKGNSLADNLMGINVESGCLRGLVITGNSVCDSGAQGIKVRHTDGAVIAENYVDGTGSPAHAGISTTDNQDVVIVGNVLKDCKMLLLRASRVAASGNTIDFDTDEAIKVRDSSDLQIVANVGRPVVDGTRFGRVVRHSVTPVVEET
jgi:hypothetical protein